MKLLDIAARVIWAGFVVVALVMLAETVGRTFVPVEQGLAPNVEVTCSVGEITPERGIVPAVHVWSNSGFPVWARIHLSGSVWTDVVYPDQAYDSTTYGEEPGYHLLTGRNFDGGQLLFVEIVNLPKCK